MTQDLETQGSKALSKMPEDLVADAGRGTSNIGEEDVRPPRVGICQAGSPQRKPDDAKQIVGLNELDMFNDLSEENYGRGPLKFVVFEARKPRYIQFAPVEEGGGVIDFDVPANDPRTQFTTGDDGKRVKPIATKFYDFLVWLVDQQEPAVVSMKGSQLKVAVQLNGKIKLPLKGELIDSSLKGQILTDPPAWARTFSLSTVMQRRDQQAWGNYVLKQESGLTPPDVRNLCRALADSYAKKNVIIERENPDDFEPAAYEAAVAGAPKADM